MPEEFIITDGRPYTSTADDLADSADHDATANEIQANGAEVTGVVCGAACDIKYVVQNSSGSDIVEITVASASSAGTKVVNPALPISTEENTLVRVTNTSGGAADFVVVGYEVE